MANAEGYVLPTPSTPKTLGILNVIFAVLLIFWGLCQAGALLAAGPMMVFAEKAVKDVQAKVQAQQKEQLKALDDREKAATTEEEKKAIRAERDSTIANAPPVQTLDMSAATSVLNDPVVMGYSYVNLLSGLLLHILLLVSGIGLIRLTAWGRSWSIAWAGLQIAQLVLLTAASLLYIQPMQRANNEKMLAKMEADARAPGAPPGATETARMTRAMSTSGAATVMALGALIGGSIYPVVLLILLNKPGSRAACQGAKPRGPGEF